MTGPAEQIFKYNAPAGSLEAGRFMSTHEIESILKANLVGTGPYLGPNKTRSKQLKSQVLELLGYPIPKSFSRGVGAVPAQALDVFVQQSDNVQAWNGKLLPDRRYVMIRPDEAGHIKAVRVIEGRKLLDLDKTQTVTTKLQARVDPHISALQLVNARDTEAVQPYVSSGGVDLSGVNPVGLPKSGQLLPIVELAKRLFDLIGASFPDPGPGSDRARGELLHHLVLDHLGFSVCGDTGRLPDIPNQLIETKLQIKDTIDLGMHDPSSTGILDGELGVAGFMPRDVRYVVASADLVDGLVKITRITIVSGAWFSTRFEMCGGLGQNGKVQIRLPQDFFSS